MYSRVLFLYALTIILSVCNAQTQTLTNPQGQPIVVAVTTDPAGAPVTQTLATLPPGNPPAPPGQAPPPPPPAQTPPPPGQAPAPTTNTQQTTTTQAPVVAIPTEPGPVGQPGPTPNQPGNPTPFVYTTVVNGQTTSLTGTFTPNDPATTATVTPTASGTVWAYSDWLSVYGGALATGGVANSGGVDNSGYHCNIPSGMISLFVFSAWFIHL